MWPGELGPEADDNLQLLRELTVKRGPGILPRVHLAARELPAPRERGRRAAASRQAAARTVQVVDEDGRYHECPISRCDHQVRLLGGGIRAVSI